MGVSGHVLCRKSTPVFWIPSNAQLSSNLLREAHRRWKSRVGKYLSEVERARPATVLGLAPTTGKRVFLSADGMKLGNPNARSSFHGDGSLTWSILVDPEHQPSLATVWFGSTTSVARVTFFGPDTVYHQAYVGARPSSMLPLDKMKTVNFNPHLPDAIVAVISPWDDCTSWPPCD
ncbi:hypothetical protein CCUS01_07200 [Colletotrichum cuscutae]|uniref:Uncharacterized protein n=1 Tax=Colletotrichum cuscutae TaxID=1209917 RepID=A0AAI9UZD7_9PEZI|nr:hypothetical protein CCUS01_07200 [Colletotrichum cuscutae]